MKEGPLTALPSPPLHLIADELDIDKMVNDFLGDFDRRLEAEALMDACIAEQPACEVP